MKPYLTLLFTIASGVAIAQKTDSIPHSKTDSISNSMAKSNPAPPKKSIGLGLRGGLNFANVTNASSINAGSETGFNVGIFYSPPSKGIVSFRTEFDFSRQGYNFATNTNSGTVNLDYILFPQLVGINITRFVQLQIGFQMAYLINAKADSSNQTSSSNPYGSVLDYYNRFDYGGAVGIEVYPFLGILVGARYSLSFGELYKPPTNGSLVPPSFVPTVDAKNNVVQIYAGYRF